MRVRLVRAVHGRRRIKPDPAFEVGLSRALKAGHSPQELLELLGRFAAGPGAFDSLMRRALWRALAKSFGHGVAVGGGAGFKHPETLTIGDGVFIGEGAFIQGRFDGRCVIGKASWLGPRSYFDARDLILGEYVGWGPGAKVLGSAHTGSPRGVPILRSDLRVRPVRIGDWADVGTNAVVLPGVTIGRGAVIGAGAVVTKDVPPFAVVAGVPARFLRWRRRDGR